MRKNNDQVSLLMKMAKTELSSEDFEDRLMDRIDRLELELESAKRSQKYAFIFFIAAAFLGMGVTFLLAETISVTNLTNNLKETILLLTNLIYVILILVISDKTLTLIRYFKRDRLR